MGDGGAVAVGAGDRVMVEMGVGFICVVGEITFVLSLAEVAVCIRVGKASEDVGVQDAKKIMSNELRIMNNEVRGCHLPLLLLTPILCTEISTRKTAVYTTLTQVSVPDLQLSAACFTRLPSMWIRSAKRFGFALA